MKKFILENPLNKDLKIQYKGNNFTLPANSGLVVSEELARFWRKLHSFISMKDIEEKVVEPEDFVFEVPSSATGTVETKAEEEVPAKRVIKKKLK